MSASPTTILFFDHTAEMSGGEIALFNIVTHLDRARFDPVVVLASDGVLRERLSAVGVETHVLPLSEAVTQVRKDSLTETRALPWQLVGEMARYVWRLREFARRRNVDILHANSLKADVIGALAGRLAGVPVLWHVHDRIADDYLPSKTARVFRTLCRFLPDTIAANSMATLETLQLPVHPRARVVYNGIVSNDSPFAQSSDETEQTASDIAHPTSHAAPVAGVGAAPILGLVGRISPWKGQDIFLRAAAQVKERYPAARFQIIGAPLFGEEAYEAEMRALCTQLELDENVEWLGFRTDVPALIERMTILAHASKIGEPFGQVVAEAMMAGRPLVATNGGGIPEIVIDEETGLLVPMDDAPAMAAALLRLLDRPDWAKELGRAGHKRALENFTIGHTVSNIHRLYDDILRDHARKTNVNRKIYQALALLGAILALVRWKGRNSRIEEN